MKRTDNYAIQAAQAKQLYLTYDQEALIRKFRLEADEAYLYPVLLGSRCRLSRTTGDLEREKDGRWVDANSYNEVMTLLDVLCDAREDRYLTGRWRSMQDFGLMFHQNLMEEGRDRHAEAYDRNPEALHRACRALGGRPIKNADIGYAIELFDGLEIGLLFWHGDEEFAPRLRYVWDENARAYIRYETMHFAVGLLLTRLQEAGD